MVELGTVFSIHSRSDTSGRTFELVYVSCGSFLRPMYTPPGQYRPGQRVSVYVPSESLV